MRSTTTMLSLALGLFGFANNLALASPVGSAVNTTEVTCSVPCTDDTVPYCTPDLMTMYDATSCHGYLHGLANNETLVDSPGTDVCARQTGFAFLGTDQTGVRATG